ncbi:TPA: Hcp family type VI secretion system effector [Serratia liquefaciens]
MSANVLVDYFLKIDGVIGESSDSKFPEWIQLQAWQWAQENAGRWGAGSGGGAGKVEMQDFEFRMLVNKASTKLFLMCATGEHIKNSQLVCRKAGSADPFLTITFENCLVSSYRTLGNMPLDNIHNDKVNIVSPVDIIKINFSGITYEYREQKTNGELGATIKSGYDLIHNKRI